MADSVPVAVGSAVAPVDSGNSGLIAGDALGPDTGNGWVQTILDPEVEGRSRSRSPARSSSVVSGLEAVAHTLGSDVPSEVHTNRAGERDRSPASVGSIRSTNSGSSQRSIRVPRVPSFQEVNAGLRRAASSFEDLARRTAQTVQTKVHDVAHSIAQRDWFQRKLRHRGNMMTPVGETPSEFGSAVNLTNGTLDGGILAMPLMMSKLGWLLGIAVLMFVASLGVFTTRLMVRTGIAEGTQSYHMTVLKTLGKRAMTVFQCVLVLACLGSLLSYLMLIGDFAVQASTQLTGTAVKRRTAISVVTILAVLPLALMRKIKSLWFTGFMAIAFVAFFVFALLLELCKSGISSYDPASIEVLGEGRGFGHVHAVHTSLSDFFQALPIAVFTCSCHAITFPVFSEMRQPTLKSFTRVVGGSITVLASLFTFTALFGYLTFGDQQIGNILDHYQGSKLMGLVNLCFLLTFTFTYPLMNFPMRICIHYLMYGETRATDSQHLLETVIPLCFVLAGALLLTDVGIVFSLIGSIATSSIYFIFPCLMFLKSSTVGVIPLQRRVLVWCVLCFGVLVLVLGVVASVTGATA